MKKFLFVLLLFVSAVMAVAAEKFILIHGRVLSDATGEDLLNAKVVLFDSKGNPKDTIEANRGKLIRRNDDVTELARYTLPVPRQDSTYVFDVICDGYMTQTVTFRLEKIGSRESSREIPTVYLKRAPRQLDEVVVTRTKIKFYHKGDTLVYNADAFQLAEGSMLDALISQLPGVTLNDNGQIKVNGQLVESLLLNGKQFLDGNNRLVLDNIGAYTVKNIEVYEGQTERQKWAGDETNKLLTMNVKLKKEYSRGLILNAQGGYGTEDRYLGRLFSSVFTPTSNYTLIGNVNNLNDNRNPGKSDTWTPEMMPSGTRQYRMGAFDYRISNKYDNFEVNGHLTFEGTANKNITNTARTNFWPVVTLMTTVIRTVG